MGIWNPKHSETGCGTPDKYIKGIPDGDRVAFSNGGEISQRTDATITTGHRYTLTVGVGGRCSIPGGKYAIRLLAGDKHVAATTGTSPKGGWTEVTVTYSSAAGDPNAGKPLTVLLENQGRTQIDYDDVRLDVAKADIDLKTMLLGDISIPGLDNLPVSAIEKTGTTTSATVKLRGKSAKVIAFKHAGVSKPYIAIVPADFKLTDFVPIPSRSPIQGAKFRNMAFVYVPKGAANSRVSTGGLPQPIRPALQHSGSTVDLKEGLNIFGEADFSVSTEVRKVLSAVGINNPRLPLGGTLAPELFKYDAKAASSKVKDYLLDNLRLDLKLPRLRIPGMPNTVEVEHARFSIVSRKFKDKHEIFAGVTGDLDVHVAGKKIDFAFYILAGKPGAQGKLTLKGDTKSTVTLPFFHPLELTGLNLTATRSGGEWTSKIDAKARLNGKAATVTVTKSPNGDDSATVKARLTLADLLPSSVRLPGLTDVEVDELDIRPSYVELKAKIKGMETVVTSFKPCLSGCHPYPLHLGCSQSPE